MFATIHQALLRAATILASSSVWAHDPPLTVPHAPETRRMSKKRRSRSPRSPCVPGKSPATCTSQALHVTITSTPSLSATAAFLAMLYPPPVFATRYTTYGCGGGGWTTIGGDRVPPPVCRNACQGCDTPDWSATTAFRRVSNFGGPSEQPLGPTACRPKAEADYDATVSGPLMWEPGSVHNGDCLSCPATMPSETAELSIPLSIPIPDSDSGTDIPQVMVPEEEEAGEAETWDDETWAAYLSWQSNQAHHHPGYLCVSDSALALPAAGPLPDRSGREPCKVFSRSQLAAFILALREGTPSEIECAAKEAYKDVAFAACAVVRDAVGGYYEDGNVLAHLDMLSAFQWTDPAAPVLAHWRNYVFISLIESDAPFSVPHIAISHAPEDHGLAAGLVALPPQDTAHLCVPPRPSFTRSATEEGLEVKDDANSWWIEGEEDSGAEPSSESEEELEEMQTPVVDFSVAVPCATESLSRHFLLEEEDLVLPDEIPVYRLGMKHRPLDVVQEQDESDEDSSLGAVCDMPRPSCDPFSRVVEKVDRISWADLPEDDLGDLDWAR